jgi:hypothetical protein
MGVFGRVMMESVEEKGRGKGGEMYFERENDEYWGGCVDFVFLRQVL